MNASSDMPPMIEVVAAREIAVASGGIAMGEPVDGHPFRREG